MLARVTRAAVKVELEVLRVLRGENLPTRLRVAFRGANLQRPVDEPGFSAIEGETAVFVLEPWVDSRGEQPAPDLFQPAIGYRSRIPIPEEGAEALLEAIEEILAIQDGADFDESRRRMLRWLSGENRWLIDVALAQAALYALADRNWTRALLDHADDASPVRRRLVAEAIGRGFERRRFAARRDPAGGRTRPARARDESVEALRETLVRLARTDEDAGVRRTAVRYLPRAGVRGVRELLAAIARDDPSLEVRYEAAAALRSLADGRNGPGARRR
ncbi:MAG: hypothetical protein Kow0062_08670 [Acidobacteriota bacterium]